MNPAPRCGPPRRIWCEEKLEVSARRRLQQAVEERDGLLLGPETAEPPGEVDIIVGKPEPAVVLRMGGVRWVHILAASFTSYDTEVVRQALAARGTVVTNSSAVYADPCAQHVLAVMMAMNRRILLAHRNQLLEREWPQWQLRGEASLLTGQTILLLGYGSIGRRLAELVGPFRVRVLALRRRELPATNGVEMIKLDELTQALRIADHVINLLPLNEETRGFMSADRLGAMQEGSAFYNLGRGATVDQEALQRAVERGRIWAHLDVLTPEPLPRDHPLWTARNCFVSPHMAGGFREEPLRLVDHFIANLDRFRRVERLVDQVV